VKNIVRELSGEKIDIIRWHPDVRRYVEESLSPAHVKDMEIDQQNQRVRVIVHDDQLSLAIGKRGQNARLTSKLTGWHVDIVSVEQLEQERADLISEEVIEVYEEVEAGAENEGDDVQYETVTVYEEVADEPSADEPSPGTAQEPDAAAPRGGEAPAETAPPAANEAEPLAAKEEQEPEPQTADGERPDAKEPSVE